MLECCSRADKALCAAELEGLPEEVVRKALKVLEKDGHVTCALIPRVLPRFSW